MEHLHHFGLSQDPFSNEPDLRFFFESASHREAQIRVERGLRQHKGLTLLTGDGGMGKTLLARRILDALEEEVFEATLLVMLPGAADATGILQRFARQIGVDEPETDRAALIGQIYEQLAIVREDGRHAVLIVDDAQIMTPEVLLELSGLLNLEYEDRRLVSMLLIGSPELDEVIQQEACLAPRVEVRVRLHPLSDPNATAYLQHRLANVGGSVDLIPGEALDALHKLGRGRPRLLNTLADNALFEAYLAGRTTVDAADIERAASDLGVGPDPGETFVTPGLGLIAAPIQQALDIDMSLAAPDLEPPTEAASDADSQPVDVLELSNAIFEPAVDLDASPPADDEFDSLSFASEPLEAEPLEVDPLEADPLEADPMELALEEAEFSSDDGEELSGVFVELLEE